MLNLTKNLPKGKAVVGLFLGSLIAMAAYSLYTTGYITLGAGNFVTVTGYAKQTQKNEISTFTATVTVRNADKNKSVAQLNTKAKNVSDSVKTFGINADDVKTTNFNVYQDSIWNPTAQRSDFTDWVSTISVEIKLRDASKASELSALLASLDTSNVYGPNFSLDDAKRDETSLIEDALADAKSKAMVVAKASGRTLGEMVSFSEGYDYSYPIMYDKMSSGMGGGGGAPMNPGTSDSTKTVTVTYRIR